MLTWICCLIYICSNLTPFSPHLTPDLWLKTNAKTGSSSWSEETVRWSGYPVFNPMRTWDTSSVIKEVIAIVVCVCALVWTESLEIIIDLFHLRGLFSGWWGVKLLPVRLQSEGKIQYSITKLNLYFWTLKAILLLILSCSCINFFHLSGSDSLQKTPENHWFSCLKCVKFQFSQGFFIFIFLFLDW